MKLHDFTFFQEMKMGEPSLCAERLQSTLRPKNEIENKIIITKY